MRFLLVLIGLLFMSDAVKAQTMIAGYPVYCNDARGFPVVTVPEPRLNDVGMARIAPNGAPVIFLNPNVLASLPPAVQLFWFAHECAHHALGHILGPPRRQNEMEADCWAIRTGRDQGWFGQSDLRGMYRYFINNPGSPWGHLPGRQRMDLFERCFRT